MTLEVWNATLRAAGINVKLTLPVRQPSALSGSLAVRSGAILMQYMSEPSIEVDWMLWETDISL